MSRTTRTAAALTAVVALGLAAPAASAAPHHHAGSHAQASHHQAHHASRLGQAQKKAAALVRTLDRRLARVAGDRALARLSSDARTQVAANVAADRASLAALGEAAASATSLAELQPVTTALRVVRPENYGVTLVTLRQVTRLTQRVADDAAALAAVTDRDVSEGVAANEAAATAVAAAGSHALALTAASTRRDLRAVGADLRTARQALDTVEQVLASDDSPADDSPADDGDDGDDA